MGYASCDWDNLISAKDPRNSHPEPPLSEKKQSPPGSEADMAPKADHGDSRRGFLYASRSSDSGRDMGYLEDPRRHHS